MKREDIKLEIEILKLMFNHWGFVRDARLISSAGWFSTEATEWIVDRLFRLSELGRHPTPNMVVNAARRTPGISENLLGEIGKICGLVSNSNSVMSVEQGREACGEVREMWKVRRISDGLAEMAELMGDGKIDEIDDELASLKIELDSSLFGTKSCGEYFADIPIREEQIRAKRSRPDDFAGVPSGLRDMDESIGVIGNGNLGVVFGYTQSGKSMALRSIGVMGWMMGRNVCHISLEDSMSIVQNAYDALMMNRFEQLMFHFTQKAQYGFPSDRDELEETLSFRKANTPTYNEFKAGLSEPQEKRWRRRVEMLHGACPHGAGINIIEMKEYSSVDEICSRIETLPDRPGLILIDYANLIASSARASEIDPLDWKSQSVVMGRLHTLSKNLAGQDGKMGVPVWVACQSHKDTEKKSISRVDLSNVTGVSYLITQPPDLCLYIRECKQVKVLKSRDSKVGDIFRAYSDFERKDLLDTQAEFRETGKIFTTRMS
jgi:hypothetical protein